MATTQGLFGPNMGDEEMSRQLLEQRAMQFAQMPQSQRLASMGYKAGSQLGSSIAGLFGVDTTDPLVKRARRLEQLRSQVDTTTPEGLRQLAALLQQEDPDTALRAVRMAQEMEMSGAKLRSEEALAQQRGREKAAADPVEQFIRTNAKDFKPVSLQAYRESGGNLSVLEPKDEKPLDIQRMQQLRDSLPEGSQQRKEVDALIAKTVQTKPSIGSEIASGLSPILGAMASAQAKKAAETAGAEVGKQVATIEGKYTAKNAVSDALDVLTKGIYAGGYGPLQEGIAKYTGGIIGSPERLARTEEFRAYIGNVVIPRLTEFGGNDSVEELKYLRSVMAGETTLEPKAMIRILKKAEKNIDRGIQRLEKQTQNIQEGRPLPTGPVEGVKVRKRWNPATGQVEEIQ